MLSVVMLFTAIYGCDPEDPCPEKTPEIKDPNGVQCTRENIRSGDGNIGAPCDIRYTINSECCYGLNCDPETATCQIGNRGRLGAPCTSTGDCMSSTRCNSKSVCVENLLDFACLAEQD